VNIKAGVGSLAWFLQFELEQDMVADAKTEAAIKTGELRSQARANAQANGEDPDAAAARVKELPPTYDSADVPSLDWCSRMAMKHAKSSKQKVGKQRGLKDELLDRVRKDPDKANRGRGTGR
jgi:hypothetical protein